MFLLIAWPVMILLGMAHSSDPRVPAFGYSVTVALVLCADLVLSLGFKTAKSGDK